MALIPYIGVKKNVLICGILLNENATDWGEAYFIEDELERLEIKKNLGLMYIRETNPEKLKENFLKNYRKTL